MYTEKLHVGVQVAALDCQNSLEVLPVFYKQVLLSTSYPFLKQHFIEMVSNQELNANREPGCWAVLADKKYFQVGNSFIKRTLRRHEWQSYKDRLIVPPATYPQRWKNDAAMLRYLGEKTNIPIPRLQCVYEDDGAFYHCTEYVEGVTMTELNEEEKQVVMKELSQHLLTLQSLRSDFPGVPGESLLCPPLRVTGNIWKVHSCWRPRQEKGEYVLCHNDFAQHNVIVDKVTLKVKAIIDWEYGGFWPKWFEQLFCGLCTKTI